MELIGQLDAIGIKPSPDEDDGAGVEGGWEDVEDSDEDVDME